MLDRGVDEEGRELAESLAVVAKLCLSTSTRPVGIVDPTARDDGVPMDVEPGDPVSDPLHRITSVELIGGCRERTWRSEI